MEEKQSWMEKATQLDRRWVFVLVALSVIIPILIGVALPVNISKDVRSVYDYIENVPADSTIMIVCDYDPASEAELYPMTLALYRHCFDRGISVVSFTMWPNGAALIERAFDEMKLEYEIEQGKDYINLGYQVGGHYNIIQAGLDLKNAFPTDYRGNSTTHMEALDGIDTLNDLGYVIDLEPDADFTANVHRGR